MPPMNAKNFALSPAAGDLGLSGGMGQLLTDQLHDEEEQRKKRLLQMAKQDQNPGIFGDGTMGNAAMSLGLGPAR